MLRLSIHPPPKYPFSSIPGHQPFGLLEGRYTLRIPHLDLSHLQSQREGQAPLLTLHTFLQLGSLPCFGHCDPGCNIGTQDSSGPLRTLVWDLCLPETSVLRVGVTVWDGVRGTCCRRLGPLLLQQGTLQQWDKAPW